MAGQAQVEIVLAPDGVEGDVYGVDKNGKRMDLPHRIIINPYFFGSTAQANLIYLTVSVGSRELNRTVLQLSGTTGKTKLLDRSSRHDPKFVSQLAAEDLAEAAEDEAEGSQEFYEDEQEADDENP